MTDPTGSSPQGAPPGVPPSPPQAPPPGWPPPQVPPQGAMPPPAFAPRYCHACGVQIDPRAEICPRCGVRQPVTTGVGQGKDRMVAAALALLLGGLGIHKFYLGKTVLGVIYLVFSWTGIPSFVAWIEAITYLLKSDVDWAAEYGGPVRRANGAALGCLWLIAVLPLVSILTIIALIFLGGQIDGILSNAGTSI